VTLLIFTKFLLVTDFESCGVLLLFPNSWQSGLLAANFPNCLQVNASELDATGIEIMNRSIPKGRNARAEITFILNR